MERLFRVYLNALDHKSDLVRVIIEIEVWKKKGSVGVRRRKLTGRVRRRKLPGGGSYQGGSNQGE